MIFSFNVSVKLQAAIVLRLLHRRTPFLWRKRCPVMLRWLLK
tara:strand:+ start:164 stop:289 length:126 start_codon:yes stop_codon:yes gene_type:complete